MPEETQNPDSWFRQARLAAGLTLTGVARELDAPIQTVHRWEQGGNRPPWPWPRKIADIFHRPVEEAVEGLLREVVGHPCGRPHNCGGTKILPDDPLVLDMFSIALLDSREMEEYRPMARQAVDALLNSQYSVARATNSARRALRHVGGHTRIRQAGRIPSSARVAQKC